MNDGTFFKVIGFFGLLGGVLIIVLLMANVFFDMVCPAVTP